MFQTVDQDNSGFKFYSLGIVVSPNMITGSHEITVSPIEQLNTQDNGDIYKSETEYTNFHPDEEGNIESSSVKGKQFIKATWLPMGQSNRTTPPDVVRNETVMLYKFKNVNKYYWDTCFNEPSLRRLENVTWTFSNNREEMGSAGYNYTINVSTKGKMVSIITDNHDGEPSILSFVMNTGTGNITVGDNLGNSISIDKSGNCGIKANGKIFLDADTVEVSGNLKVAGAIMAASISAGSISGDSFSSGSGEIEVGGATKEEDIDEGDSSSSDLKSDELKLENYLKEDGTIDFDRLSSDAKTRSDQITQLLSGMTADEIMANGRKLGLGDMGTIAYAQKASMQNAYYLDSDGKVQIKEGAKPKLSPLYSQDKAIREAAKKDSRWVPQVTYVEVSDWRTSSGSSVIQTTPIYSVTERPNPSKGGVIMSVAEYQAWQAADQAKIAAAKALKDK